MKNITDTLHNLAQEAKAEESKIVGRHRKTLTPNQKVAYKAHRTAVHLLHTGQLAAIGLPAIFAFEIGRPAWVRFVETPIAELMFGHSESTTTHAIGTVAQHFIG